MNRPSAQWIWEKLSLHLQVVFNEQKLLSARDWKIFVGTADYLDQPQVPNEFKDKNRAAALGITARYAMALSPTPVSVTDDGAGEFSFGLVKDKVHSNARLLAPAAFLRRRADLVTDDAEELPRCQFPYTSVATHLTPAYRRKVYGSYLGNVLPPSEEDTGFFHSGATFIAAAAERATYSTQDGAGSYYQKWLIDKPRKPADRKFGFDQLTDTYLKENFQPFELQKDAVYVCLQISDGETFVLIQLDLGTTRHAELTWKSFYAEGLPLLGNHFTLATEYLKELRARKSAKTPAEAWFFYAVGGTSEFLALPASDSKTGIDAYFEQVVDPQYLVQSTRGLAWDQIDKDQLKWRSRDWLKEMVRLRFSEPWVWFWNNTYQQMYYDIDREALFLSELRKEEQKTSGELKARLREFRRMAERDEKILLLRRGSKYGNAKRLIGSDSSYVYFYDSQQDLVTRLPMGVFWKSVNISRISSVIFNNTRGMIPICKVLAWGGVAVMGWGIFGTASLVNGFRQYVTDRVRGALADAALRERFIEIRNRILLSLLNPLLALIPTDQFNSAVARAFGFFRGFILGYTHDALVAMYHRWESFAALEPASYRAVKLLMKIEGVLRMVDEKISLIKDHVNRRIGDLLADRVVATFEDAMQGMIGLVNNLYFLDYERVEPFLKAYEDLTREKAPKKHEWDRLRHQHLLATFREYHEAILKEQTDIKELYRDVKKAVVVLQRAVRFAETYLIVEVVSGGVLMAMVMHALTKGAKVAWKAGKVVGTATIVAAAVNSNVRETLIEGLQYFARVTGKGAAKGLSFVLGRSPITPERMESLGQLIGELWGGMTLNKAVFGKQTWTERWNTSTSYKGFVTKNFLKTQLSVSPVLPIIKLALFNYVFLIEKVIAQSKQAWSSLEDELEVILLGDPAFRDIIEEDGQLTLTKILKIVNAVDAALTQWLQQLAEEPDLTLHIAQVAALLEKVSPSKLPTFKMLRDGTFPEGGWSREAVMFVVLSHLQASLRYLGKSIEDLHAPVDPLDDKSISVMYLLQLVGFQQSESEINELLDRNFDEALPAPDSASP